MTLHEKRKKIFYELFNIEYVNSFKGDVPGLLESTAKKLFMIKEIDTDRANFIRDDLIFLNETGFVRH